MNEPSTNKKCSSSTWTRLKATRLAIEVKIETHRWPMQSCTLGDRPWTVVPHIWCQPSRSGWSWNPILACLSFLITKHFSASKPRKASTSFVLQRSISSYYASANRKNGRNKRTMKKKVRRKISAFSLAFSFSGRKVPIAKILWNSSNCSLQPQNSSRLKSNVRVLHKLTNFGCVITSENIKIAPNLTSNVLEQDWWDGGESEHYTLF